MFLTPFIRGVKTRELEDAMRVGILNALWNCKHSLGFYLASESKPLMMIVLYLTRFDIVIGAHVIKIVTIYHLLVNHFVVSVLLIEGVSQNTILIGSS